MKIAVLGSWRQEAAKTGWALKHQNFFEVACTNLGLAINRNGHDLIIAHADEATADKYVAEGFASGTGGGRRTKVELLEGSRIWAAAHLGAVELAEIVIIIGGGDGSYTAGLAALQAKKKLIPIGCFGGAAAELLRELWKRGVPDLPPILSELDPEKDQGWENTLTARVLGIVEAYPKLLIIHGRNPDYKTIKSILQSFRNEEEFKHLPDPIIMKDVAKKAARALPEIFEALAAKVDAAIAVVTPDDIGISCIDADGEPIPATALREFTFRARQNVWIEIGWFWGRLGRDRFMILRKGNLVDLPTDLGSAFYHNYNSDPNESTTNIRDFVRNMRAGVLGIT